MLLMKYIKYFLKTRCENTNYMQIDRITSMCILSEFFDDICELNRIMDKQEYTIDDLVLIIEERAQYSKINKTVFKNKLKTVLDEKSTNELVEILFQDCDETDFISLNKNINELLIK